MHSTSTRFFAWAQLYYFLLSELLWVLQVRAHIFSLPTSSSNLCHCQFTHNLPENVTLRGCKSSLHPSPLLSTLFSPTLPILITTPQDTHHPHVKDGETEVMPLNYLPKGDSNWVETQLQMTKIYCKEDSIVFKRNKVCLWHNSTIKKIIR